MKSIGNKKSRSLLPKIKLKNWFGMAFFALIFSACEDVVELDLPDGETRLVVEGTVYYGQPLQEVILSTTAPFFADGETPRVSDAVVVIEDNLGNRETLLEVEKGIYQLDKQGELGKSYRIEITLSDGRKYGSSYQDLNPIAQIDSIYYQYQRLPFADENDSTFSINFDFTEPGESEDFYRWNYYVNGEYFNEDVTFTNDEFFNGIEVKEVGIVREFLEKGDTVLIEQMSITKEYYDFLVRFEQTLSAGGLFSSPPIPVRGNIVNLNDPKDYALGFFGVSSITKAEIVIK